VGPTLGVGPARLLHPPSGGQRGSIISLPGTSAISLLGRLSLLAARACALLGGLGLITQLVVQLCELVAQIRDPLVKVRGLFPGVRGGRSCQPRLGCGAAGPRLGFAAQLLEQPDPLDQALSV
jgi:hypothetical protein